MLNKAAASRLCLYANLHQLVNYYEFLSMMLVMKNAEIHQLNQIFNCELFMLPIANYSLFFHNLSHYIIAQSHTKFQ